MYLKIHDPQRVPSRICKNKCMAGHIIIKLQNTRERKKKS